MSVSFFEQNVKARFKDKRRLSGFIQNQVTTHLPHLKAMNLTYVFCGDEFLLHINQQYLNHDTLTDIITFDLSDNKNELLGEIYVSVERVKENAALFGVPYQEELHRVIFHGALHLCGFKDKNEAERKLMRSKENEWLRMYHS